MRDPLRPRPPPPPPCAHPVRSPSALQAVVGCCCALGGGLLYARARTNLARKAMPRETSQEISKRLIMSAVDEEEEEVAMK